MKIYSVVVSEYYSNDIVAQSSFHNTETGAIRESILCGIIISENDLSDFHIDGYEAAVITRELIIDGDDCPVTIVTEHEDGLPYESCEEPVEGDYMPNDGMVELGD